MALLSNINDKFAVDSTGAIQFNGQVGTSGYVLKSNANAAPTWVDPSTVIGGPYLPLSGGTLTGALAGTSATFSGSAQFGQFITMSSTQAQYGYLNLGATGVYGWQIGKAPSSGGVAGNESFYLYNFSNSTTALEVDTSNDATFSGDVLAPRFNVGTTSTSIIQESNRMKFTNAIANNAGGFDFFTRNSSSTYINALQILGNGNSTFAKAVNIAGTLTLDQGSLLNGIINTPASLRINIDSSNTGIGEVFMVGHNQTNIDNNNVLFKVEENGNSTFSGNVTLSQPTNGSDAILNLTSKSAAGNSRTSTIEYDADNEYMYFKNAGTTVATMTSGGNVGIKNTSPSDFLSWQQQLVVGSGSADAGITLYHGSGSGNQGAIVFADGNTGTDRYRGSISYNGADEMKFFTSTAERIRINSSGNVTIKNPTTSNLQLQSDQNSWNENDVISNLNTFISDTSAAGARDVAAIKVINEQSGTNTTTSGAMAFYTSAYNATAAERMRITSDGYLNAGGYTTASNTHHKIVTTRTNSETLRVENNSASPYGQIIRHGSAAPNTTDNWFLVCEDNAFSRLIIWSNGNVINRNNSYGGYSDIKLKENIVDATPKLDDLIKVKIRNYNLIGDDKKQIGVVAQELEEVFPSMIDESKIPDSEDETLYKGVKYSVFVPMLIKAIQELEARVKELENK